ncbi:PKD domain-containing protein, partial [Thiolapillus sp.]
MSCAAAANQAPVAEAGNDLEVHVGTRVSLDGSLSIDPDGDALIYAWELVSRPPNSSAILVDSSTVSPSFLVDVPGIYEAELRVSDGKQGSSPDRVIIRTQNSPPIAEIHAPATVMEGDPVVLGGTASRDADGDSLSYDWTLLAKPPSSQALVTGARQPKARLRTDLPGSYTIGLIVSDGQASSTQERLTIVAQALSNHPPKITSFPITHAQVLSEFSYDVEASDPDGDALSYHVEHPPAGMTVHAGTGSIRWTPKVSGYFGIYVRVTDAKGASAYQYFNLRVEPVSPGQPGDVPAPGFQPLPFPGYFERNRFLVESIPPAQTDTLIGNFSPDRASGVAGRVVDARGNALPGVKVSVAGRPEYGATLTRSDGSYRLLLNGGGQQQIAFARDDYVVAQQVARPAWNRDQVLKDLRLLVKQPQATELYSSTAGGLLQSVPDNPALLSPVLLFDTGMAVFPGGSSVALPPSEALYLRLTDFSRSGNDSLPVPLAEAWSGSSVVALVADGHDAGLSFGGSMPLYLPNHQQFPVGTALPAGRYNREKGGWLPAGTGHVLQLVDVTNGLAELSLDAAGTPLDAAGLAQLGISEHERAWLAQHHAVGALLLRAPLTGTGVWAVGLPLQSQVPQEQPPADNPVDLTEAQPLVKQFLAMEGTPYELHYSSERVPGYAAARTLVIPLTGEQVSTHLRRVELIVRIAGQMHRAVFAPEPQLSYTFEWDGLDLYGRQINGLRTARIEVNHYYDAGFQLPPESGAAIFGDVLATSPQVSQADMQVKVSRRWNKALGIYTPEYTALGGWGLNVHHAWQRESGRLFLGMGDTRVYDLPVPRHTQDARLDQIVDLRGVISSSAQSLSMVIDGQGSFQVGEGQSINHYSPDGVLQRTSNLFELLADEWGIPVQISDIASWREDLLIADRQGNRLLLLRGNEVLPLFSGEGSECGGDMLCEPVAVAAGQTGDVVVAAQGSHRIYRWVENQGLRNFAGTGDAGQFAEENGDGGSARLARFGQLGDMVWDGEGALYVIDNYPDQGYRIRRIDPLGIITTVLREATPGLAAVSLAMDRQNVLIVGESRCRLRMLYPDGSDGFLDLSASMDGETVCLASADALALHPDGGLYLGSKNPAAVYRLAHRHVVRVDGLYRLKGPAMDENYWFDAHGRHVKTTDLTGAIRYSFAYDASGRLSEVTDAGGQSLAIDRDPQSGNIVLRLPNGEDVTLGIGADGYLSSVHKANGDVWSWQYDATGGLVRAQDPAGNTQSYYYTPYGGSTPTPYSALPVVSPDVPPAPGDSSLVATIPGEFGVTANGGASYNIPIAVPPGRGGMAPKIALQYNSQGGNGLLGVGWSLGGLSTIHRCNRTLAQDNRVAAVELVRADALCLDGRRMRLVSGAQGEVGSVYRLEIDDYTKIEMLRDAQSGRAYFKAWSKSGEIMEYGRTADARVDTPTGKVQRWALNRVTDVAQNYFLVRYQKNTGSGEHYVSRIDYTGNSKANQSTHSSILFGYENRPDISFGYLAQTRISSTKRLNQISVYEGNVLVRRYAFDYYATDHSNPRSRLAQIRKCMNVAGTQCVAPTLIEWYPAANPKVDEGFDDPSVSDYGVIGDSDSRDAAQVLDFNGDGIADLAYPRRDGGRMVVDLYNTEGEVAASNHLESNETAPHASTGPWPYAPFLAMDVDADGDTDILIPQTERQTYPDGDGNEQSAWKITGWKKLSYRSGGIVSEEITIADTKDSWGCDRWSVVAQYCQPIVLDANGDGLQDLLFPVVTPGALGLASLTWELLLNSASSPGTFTKASGGNNPIGEHRFMVIDMNGDGMQDLFSVNNHLFLSRGDHFEHVNLGWSGPAADKKSLVIDINGDGYQDLVWFASKGVKYRLNLGGTRLTGGAGSFASTDEQAQLDGLPGKLQTGVEKMQSVNSIDYDKDGVTDIILAQKQGRTNNWWVLLTRSDAFGNPRFEAIDTGVPVDEDYKRHPQIADFNGDGFGDLLHGRNNRWQLLKRKKNRGNLVRRITAGRGRTNDVIAIEYQPLTKGIHTAMYANPDSRRRYFQAPMFVVSEVQQDTGQGGVRRQKYHYEGARVHVQGRGFQGFFRQIIEDLTAGLTETQTFAQDFPYTGSLIHKEIKRSSDGRLLAMTENTLDRSGWTPANDGRIDQPYVKTSVEKRYDLITGQHIDTRETTVQEPDLAGNIEAQQVTVTDALTGKTHIKTTQSTYQNSNQHWLLGRLETTTVTHSGSAYGAEQIVRKSRFTYHMAASNDERPTGLLDCEIVEPDKPAFKLSKCRSYDSYGNLETTATVGTDIAARSETTIFDEGEVRGRFPDRFTNALGHQESYQYDGKFGFRTSLTGPNGLVTTWKPDALGRLHQEIRADGTTTTVSYQWGSVNCPANTVYRMDTITSGAPDQYQCFDKKGRAIGEAVRGFDGQWRRTDTGYDSLGRVSRVSRPHIPGVSPAGWTVTAYDVLNRPRTVNSPITGVTTYHYGIYGDEPHEIHTKGQSVLVTNGLGQQTLTVSNAQGQKLAVRDALAYWIHFTYDAAGNTTTVTDPDGNRIVTAYNLRGEKTRVDDPDMGIWVYEYNVLGELISQTDAKQQTLVMEYDKLGRMIRRYLQTGPDSTEERWVWDQYPTAQSNNRGKSIGKLVRESAPGFTRDHYYDGLGRPHRTDTRIDDKAYSALLSFDGYSRPAIRTYPGGQGVRVAHGYNEHGYLDKVFDADNPGVVYWEGLSVNDDGAFTRERIGGTLTEHSYDAADGRLDSIVTGAEGSLQDLAYDFDNQGNLKTRTDHRQGTSESFTHDSLNRLKTITTTAGGSYSRNFSYDALGNIEVKDGAAYSYQNGRPHAVSSAGAHNYHYDANGNLYQGAGRSLTWDHRNRLTRINDSISGDNLDFAYDADGNRYKQTITRSGAPLPFVPCDLNGQQIRNQSVAPGDALSCQHATALIGANPQLVVNAGALACLQAPQISLQAGFAVRLGGRLRAGSALDPACNTGVITKTIHYVGDLERIT